MSPAPRPIAAAIAAAALAAGGVVAFAAPAAAASGDLFISEYVEGSSNNKAIEIYNPGTTAVDLAATGYKLQQYSNGSPTVSLTINLTGSVAPGDVYVFSHALANAAILAQADQSANLGLFNGNDAVALVKGTEIVDVIGQIGVDPGSQWGTGLASTMDNTLRRNASIVQATRAARTRSIPPSNGPATPATRSTASAGTSRLPTPIRSPWRTARRLP